MPFLGHMKISKKDIFQEVFEEFVVWFPQFVFGQI